jgi:hypothetical protein
LRLRQPAGESLRSGSATLCGYSEFASPSAPPKKYLVKTFGGTGTVRKYQSGTCPGTGDLLAGTCILSFSGSNHYAPGPSACGSEIVGASATVQGGGAGAPSVIPVTSLINGCALRCSDGVELITTKTRQSRRWQIAGGAGCVDGCEAENDEHFEELSNEDTEDMAISRNLASWTEFQPSFSCCAGIQPRTTGFTFNFQSAELKIVVSGTPGRLVNIDVPFARSSYGTVPAAVSWVDTHQVSIGGGGTAELELTVPNARGFSTCAFPASLSPDQPAQ